MYTLGEVQAKLNLAHSNTPSPPAGGANSNNLGCSHIIVGIMALWFGFWFGWFAPPASGTKDNSGKPVPAATANHDFAYLKAKIDKVAAREQEIRELKARVAEAAINGPLTLAHIQIWNQNSTRTQIGTRFSHDAKFASSSLRYVTFSIDLKNNLSGIKKLSGNLDVKYVDPYGVVSTSDHPYALAGYSFGVPVNITDTQAVEHGWGNDTSTYIPGMHRIEFWWKGRKLAERQFEVY